VCQALSSPLGHHGRVARIPADCNATSPSSSHGDSGVCDTQNLSCMFLCAAVHAARPPVEQAMRHSSIAARMTSVCRRATCLQWQSRHRAPQACTLANLALARTLRAGPAVHPVRIPVRQVHAAGGAGALGGPRGRAAAGRRAARGCPPGVRCHLQQVLSHAR